MTATHFRGSDGTIEINDNAITVVEFSVDVETSVIASPRVGKVADMKYPGKQDVTGTITQVLVTPELLSWVLGDSSSTTTSAAYVLLGATDLSVNAREELTITNDPTIATSVQATLAVGDVSTNAGSIVIHGKDAGGSYITEVLDFAAMNTGTANQVVYGSVSFTETNYVDVSANLEQTTTPTHATLKLDGVTGVKTTVPGNATIFKIMGEVRDSNNNYAKITCDNCFFTSGNFPIGDSNTLVSCDLPFVIQDADEDVELVWTTTV